MEVEDGHYDYDGEWYDWLDGDQATNDEQPIGALNVSPLAILSATSTVDASIPLKARIRMRRKNRFTLQTPEASSGTANSLAASRSVSFVQGCGFSGRR